MGIHFPGGGEAVVVGGRDPRKWVCGFPRRACVSILEQGHFSKHPEYIRPCLPHSRMWPWPPPVHQGAHLPALLHAQCQLQPCAPCMPLPPLCLAVLGPASFNSQPPGPAASSGDPGTAFRAPALSQEADKKLLSLGQFSSGHCRGVNR